MAKIKVAKASVENSPFDTNLGFLCLLNSQFGAVPIVGTLLLLIIVFLNFFSTLTGGSNQCVVP